MKNIKPYITLFSFAGLLLLVVPCYGIKDTIQSFIRIDSIDRKICIQQAIQKTDSLQKQKLYPQALNYLWNRYRKIPSPRLRAKSKELIISWSLSMRSDGCQDLDRLFYLAEKRWNHSIDSYWYKNLKIKLLDNCYHCLKKQGIAWEKQMGMITQLRNIQNSSDINREYWFTKGQLALTQSRFWESAYHFKKVHPKDEQLQYKIQDVLEKAFKQSFQQEDYQTVYENGSDFLSQISSSLTMRHIYGHSCAALHHYRQAVTQYEWLLDNWKDSSDINIELDTLYNRLKDVYTYTLDFRKASELDKLNFKRYHRKEDLYSYLGNLRARYLKPLIKVLPDLMNKLDEHQKKHLFQNYPIIFQPFIQGIYIINSNKESLQTLYRNNQASAPGDLALDDINHYPAYLESGTKRDFFLINQVHPQEFIILHLDKSMTEKGGALFANIIKNPNQFDYWKELIDHEQAQCLKTLSQCITAMFEIEIGLGLQNPLHFYWSILEKNDLLLYMVIHGENGKILDREGFKKDLASYRRHQYKKSATTMAFYQQTIRYKDQRVFDVSNPIFRENGWYAALRMGFRKD